MMLAKQRRPSSQSLILAVLGAIYIYHVINYFDGTSAVRELDGANHATTTAATKNACATEGKMEPPTNRIEISKNAIMSHSSHRREELKNFTIGKYEKYFTAPPGREHYALLSYLSDKYGDCRHLTDIGTRYVASSLALSSNPITPVWTFDLPSSIERRKAFRWKGEQSWQNAVRQLNVDIVFHNVDLLTVAEDDFRRYMSTWLIMLDTAHLPYTLPFEREFMARLISIGYKGVLILDDIHLNSEMEQWWKELKDSPHAGLYRMFDISHVGHFSGTGLLDFSGRVYVEDDQSQTS